MSTVLKTISGRPVTGSIPTRYREKRPEQLSIQKFLEALDKLFAFSEVEAVRWSQYTPSFNDGDPCVFTTGEFTVKVFDGDEAAGENEDGYLTEYCIDRHFSTYEDEYTWRDDKHHPIAKLLDDELGYNAIKAYYDALEDAFGDPAEIVATREGFHVEDYDCGY